MNASIHTLQQTLTLALTRLAPTRKGVLLALLSTLLFTLVATIVKRLSQSIDPIQILLFRQLVFIALLLPGIIKAQSSLFKPKYKALHSARIAGAFTALYCGFLTFAELPLANATAIGFTQVLFVAALSSLWLKEGVSNSRWLVLLTGFMGVCLVIQPNFSTQEIDYVAVGLLGALGAAIAVLCVRKLSGCESKLAILSYQAIAVGVMALIPSIAIWQWPTPEQWCWLVAVGVLSSLAQWVGVSAYHYAAANVVANVEYMKILYALVLGLVMFSEIPNSLALLGAAMILLSPLLQQRRQLKGSNS
ncbi:DMT family transporter [Ferrimonas aestuarii]|uniref:DMT family transporter n=1 Tax=Ferrimonas aestuarii TaxID=2569539 RepID=A0A4U1BH84_9GAMM|nr:DMT family transporter [Ferrimonas aestuarii]TKB50101.1 DMT family transporter [Ferrimonas aestuarii]